MECRCVVAGCLVVVMVVMSVTNAVPLGEATLLQPIGPGGLDTRQMVPSGNQFIRPKPYYPSMSIILEILRAKCLEWQLLGLTNLPDYCFILAGARRLPSSTQLTQFHSFYDSYKSTVSESELKKDLQQAEQKVDNLSLSSSLNKF